MRSPGSSFGKANGNRPSRHLILSLLLFCLSAGLSVFSAAAQDPIPSVAEGAEGAQQTCTINCTASWSHERFDRPTYRLYGDRDAIGVRHLSSLSMDLWRRNHLQSAEPESHIHKSRHIWLDDDGQRELCRRRWQHDLDRCGW